LTSPKGFEESIDSYLQCYRERIPTSTLPIASAGGGDLLLIDLGTSGAINYWDHNFEGELVQGKYYANVEQVAASFNDLLEALH
jgi:hypothetical protein